MQQVEQHIIKRGHQYYNECDKLCFLSKNLRNTALYNFRQAFIGDNSTFINYYDAYKTLRYEHDYKQLPDKVSKGTLRQLYTEVKSFIRSIKDWSKNPHKYKGRPNLPKYKHRIQGRYLVTYEFGAINKRNYNKTNKLLLSKTNIFIDCRIPIEQINQVRIVPVTGGYCIEVVYTKPKLEQPKLNSRKYAAIDLGLNNLVSMVFNDGSRPLIINGKPLKSINQYYNKKKSRLQSELESKQYVSKRIERLTLKRNCKIKTYLHNASSIIVNQLVSRGVSTLVVGTSVGWKQDINIGRVNNQNFVSVPFYKFIQMLEYKCECLGIEIIKNEESYTSKCKALLNFV